MTDLKDILAAETAGMVDFFTKCMVNQVPRLKWYQKLWLWLRRKPIVTPESFRAAIEEHYEAQTQYMAKRTRGDLDSDEEHQRALRGIVDGGPVFRNALKEEDNHGTE